MKIDKKMFKQRISGPGGLMLVLDISEMDIDDPGQGTPAMIYADNYKYSGTYFAVIAEGEIEGYKPLTVSQLKWLDSVADDVDDWINDTYKYLTK